MTAEVCLDVPADSVYSFAPRVVAAWLVAETGAAIDSVEDARLAVDEIVAAFVAAAQPLAATFRIGDGTAIDVELVNDNGGGAVELSPVARRILAVVAEACGPATGERQGYRLRLRTGAS